MKVGKEGLHSNFFHSFVFIFALWITHAEKMSWEEIKTKTLDFLIRICNEKEKINRERNEES